MPCEPVQRDHLNPFVERIKPPSRDKVFFQSADFPERFRMVEREKLFGKFIAARHVDFPKTSLDFGERWRTQPRSGECQAEWIDVVAERNATEQRSLDRRRSPAHKRIVNDVARRGQSFDEESRELRFETSPIGNFMERTGLPLPRGPELVDERRHGTVRESGFHDPRGLAEFRESGKIIKQQFAVAPTDNGRRRPWLWGFLQQ